MAHLGNLQAAHALKKKLNFIHDRAVNNNTQMTLADNEWASLKMLAHSIQQNAERTIKLLHIPLPSEAEMEQSYERFCQKLGVSA